MPTKETEATPYSDEQTALLKRGCELLTELSDLFADGNWLPKVWSDEVEGLRADLQTELDRDAR